MAQTVHLKLTIDGNDIEGESTIQSMDRDGTIECSSFEYMVTASYDDRMLIGRHKHEPVVIQKRIDKSTPLLLKALCRHETVDRAEFRFFRPSPGGSGTEEHFYTVILERGYISSVKQVSEDDIVGGQPAPPMMETVAFTFEKITWTYENGGVTYIDGGRK